MAPGVAQAAEAPLLEMEGVSKRFGATVALAGVSFSVRAGEVHGLVGENGAGKSTLMKALSGALQPDSGRMRLGDAVYAPRNPLDARRAGVAMIYQELSLANHLTVEENILLGMEPHRGGFIRRREVRERAVEALSHFEHPEIRPDIQGGRSGVAAQQGVGIARGRGVGSAGRDGADPGAGGTSGSTALVGGTVALLLSAAAALTQAQIALILDQTAHGIDSVNPGLEGLLGAGRLDVAAAVAEAVPAGPGSSLIGWLGPGQPVVVDEDLLIFLGLE